MVSSQHTAVSRQKNRPMPSSRRENVRSAVMCHTGVAMSPRVQAPISSASSRTWPAARITVRARSFRIRLRAASAKGSRRMRYSIFDSSLSH